MVTVVPTPPDAGVNDVIVGSGFTVKLVALVAVRLFTVTVITPVVVPAGTDVVMLESVLAVTNAALPLNLTILSAGIELKLVPAIETVVPMGPEEGKKDEIDGGPIRFLNRDIVLLDVFEVTRSGLPSPSRSPIAIPYGVVPVVKSTFVSKDSVVIEPGEEVLLKTDTELL
jgi:hypothetical protein